MDIGKALVVVAVIIFAIFALKYFTQLVKSFAQMLSCSDNTIRKDEFEQMKSQMMQQEGELSEALETISGLRQRLENAEHDALTALDDLGKSEKEIIDFKRHTSDLLATVSRKLRQDFRIPTKITRAIDDIAKQQFDQAREHLSN